MRGRASSRANTTRRRGPSWSGCLGFMGTVGWPSVRKPRDKAVPNLDGGRSGGFAEEFPPSRGAAGLGVSVARSGSTCVEAQQGTELLGRGCLSSRDLPVESAYMRGTRTGQDRLFFDVHHSGKGDVSSGGGRAHKATHGTSVFWLAHELVWPWLLVRHLSDLR